MIDSIVTIISPLIAIVALYFALKKQRHEVDNIDADTIKTLYQTVHDQESNYKLYKEEQEKCYAKLAKDFADYKATMNAQFADVVNENVKLRKWAKKLVVQLEQAGIIPVTYEL